MTQVIVDTNDVQVEPVPLNFKTEMKWLADEIDRHIRKINESTNLIIDITNRIRNQ